MDFTIGGALYYSSSGEGLIDKSDTNNNTIDNENDNITTIISNLLPIPNFDIKEIEGKKIEKNIPCCQPNCKRIANIKCSIKSCKKCCVGLHKKAELFLQGKDISKLYLNVCNLEEAKNINSIEELSKDYCKYHKVGNIIEGEKKIEKECLIDINYNIKYKSEARVLLNGLGADELFCGYLRHRKVYDEEGIEGLKKERELDINRLWYRNLGRDDRCISDNGKEVRFPYLDEKLYQLIDKIPINEIVDFSLPKGYGDKIILRKICYMIGLIDTSKLEKRAIQFGSRIARETSLNEFGESCKKVSGNAKISMIEE